MGRRLAALAIALLVTASGQSPCTVAALTRSSAAGAHEHAAAAHAHPGASEGHCHEPSTTISASCLCGCTGDLPRAAASAFQAAWALPAPPLPRIGSGAAAAEPGHLVRPAERVPPGIDHVPIDA